MTVIRNCLMKYGIPYERIGRLEVGTETLIDKSKSVKSVMMQLFEASGNMDVEGVDTVNACYGGTSAVLNCINWIESSSWDGRYALAVAADIAVYDKGPARPSGGAAAVAILIGPDAPVVLATGLRASYMEHAYDFYKPIIQTEYPHVDGKFSLSCYYKAFDACYQGLMKKAKALKDLRVSKTGADHLNESGAEESRSITSIKDIDYIAFHTPFTKLVSKCAARIAYNEYLLNNKDPDYECLAQYDSITPEASYTDKGFEKTLISLDSRLKIFENKTYPAVSVSKYIGNSYCASVWVCLASLLSSPPGKHQLLNKNILLFSYGSGLASTALILTVKREPIEIMKNLNITQILSSRTKVSPETFEIMLDRRQNTFSPDYTPKGEISPENYFPNTYYLTGIDSRYRRSYELYERP